MPAKITRRRMLGSVAVPLALVSPASGKPVHPYNLSFLDPNKDEVLTAHEGEDAMLRLSPAIFDRLAEYADWRCDASFTTLLGDTIREKYSSLGMHLLNLAKVLSFSTQNHLEDDRPPNVILAGSMEIASGLIVGTAIQCANSDKPTVTGTFDPVGFAVPGLHDRVQRQGVFSFRGIVTSNRMFQFWSTYQWEVYTLLEPTEHIPKNGFLMLHRDPETKGICTHSAALGVLKITDFLA